MPPQTPAWLLLVTNLPGRNPTLRVRIWRALKAAGSGLLRDGAYLLPNRERSRQVLEEQGAEIKAGGRTLCLAADLVTLQGKLPRAALREAVPGTCRTQMGD